MVTHLHGTGCELRDVDVVFFLHRVLHIAADTDRHRHTLNLSISSGVASSQMLCDGAADVHVEVAAEEGDLVCAEVRGDDAGVLQLLRPPTRW